MPIYWIFLIDKKDLRKYKETNTDWYGTMSFLIFKSSKWMHLQKNLKKKCIKKGSHLLLCLFVDYIKKIEKKKEQ